jgi:hypothetical protein
LHGQKEVVECYDIDEEMYVMNMKKICLRIRGVTGKYLPPCALYFMIFAIFPNNAHAYFDPGIGSVLLQALAAGFLGFVLFWERIKNGVMGLFSKKCAAEPSPPDDEKDGDA